MRLLPKEQDWTAYLWLVYMPGFTAVPFLFRFPPLEREATIAATVVALGLYFWGYWLRGAATLIVIAGFMLLGVLFGAHNPGASVLFVYGASFIGKTFEPPRAWWCLAIFLTAIALQSWVLHFSPECWISAMVFSALIGSVVIQQLYRRGLTLKLLRAQEEVEHLARVAERERIARDLHDLLGHTLSVIVLKSELASKLFDRDLARARNEIREVESISREALTQVRAAVRGYRLAGIQGELHNARTALEAAGVQLEAEVEPPTLTPAQETVFALALREGVTNVVRHAQASICRLTLRGTGQYCELEVSDDGRGGAMVEGSGLKGMRERVEAIGGAVQCDGSHGTSLRVRVPV
ncbi:MAG TPA: sensor histidine kinase [Verrucomicrobiae bacterium]|nr:sensor histidine kinase [Verrucomicrobiae bacterium]